MSSKWRITVISMTVSMIYFMTENVQAMGKCERELKDFGYNGQLYHDSHYFEIKDFKPITWIPKYRVFIDYIGNKIFSTKSDLVAIHCNNVEILFDEGFTGVLPIDILLSAESTNPSTTPNPLVVEYIAFCNDEPYSEMKDKESQFKFGLVYEFALRKKIETTEEGIPCKRELRRYKYNGHFFHDILELEKKEKSKTFSDQETDEDEISFVIRYNKFMNYAKTYVLFTDINIRDVTCDLIIPLNEYGFTGRIKQDRELLENIDMNSDHRLKEEIRIYEGFLKRVNVLIYTDVGLTYPKNFLSQLGLHKLGKIMY